MKKRLFGWRERWKTRLRQLKTETYVLYLAYKHPQTPWYAKALAIFVVAHTLSPIDLIPDFIPGLGYLDDLVITPLGILLSYKMIPESVLEDARRQAETDFDQYGRLAKMGGLVVVAIWLVGCLVMGGVVYGVVVLTTNL